MIRFLIGIFLFVSSFVFGQNNSLLYQVKGKDKKVSYLFGTIHMIPDSLYYFPGKLDKIISKSDEVVLEIADVSDRVKAQKLIKLESGSCFDIFTPEQKDSVLNWGAQTMKIKPEQFEYMFQKSKPFVLMQLSFQKMMQGDVHTVDMEIHLKAQSLDIKVSGLESMEDQIGVFDRIPSAEVAEMILNMIRNPKEQEEVFFKMAHYYHKQDLENLTKMILDTEEFGSVSEDILDKRNQNWIPKMDALLSSKSCFFAVGAGHLGGPVPCAGAEADTFQEHVGALAPLGRGHVAVDHRQLDVLRGGKPRQQLERLENEADFPAPQAGGGIIVQ